MLYDDQSTYLEQTVTKYKPGSSNKDAMELAIELGCIMMSLHLVASFQPEIEQARRSGNKLFELAPFDTNLFDKSTERVRSEDYDGHAKFQQDYGSTSANVKSWPRQDQLTIIIYLIHIGSVRPRFAREQQFFLAEVVELFKLSDDGEIKELINDATRLFGYDLFENIDTQSTYEPYEPNFLIRILKKAFWFILLVMGFALGITVLLFGWPIFVLFWVVLSVPFVTYVMALVKWFITDHHYFWEGLKDLVWALVPLINISYVWDWWEITGAFIWKTLETYYQWLV